MSAVVAAVSGVVGAVVGSFGGVVADRVPRKESIVRPPSHCTGCGKALGALENIPVVSYIALRGRCRACGARIPRRDVAVEVATALLFVAVALRVGSVWAVPAYCALAASLVALTAIDLEHLRLPTPIVYGTAALGAPLLVLASAGTHRWAALGTALISAAAVLVAFGALFYAVPRGVGFGDVRLASLCGGFLGWIGYREVLLGIVLAFLFAGLPAIVLLALRKVNRRTQLPFGPFLAAGTMASVLFGPLLVRYWLGA